MKRLVGKAKARARARARKARQSKGGRRSQNTGRVPRSVRKHLSWSSLNERHPLNPKVLRATRDTMRMLGHLADDIETIEHASGADALFSAIRKNCDRYDDFRYELRIAGAVQRSLGQEVLSLAGLTVGPDIVFRSRSGHKVGMACYRANSSTELVVRRRHLARRLIDTAFAAFRSSPLRQSFTIVLSLEDREVDEGTERAASKMLERMLVDPSVEGGVLIEENVKANRIGTDLRLKNETRCVRVRILFNTRPFETARVARHMRDKAQKEAERWADAFDGAPILVVEASDGAQEGALVPALREILEADACPFWGGIITWLPRTGIETVESFMVPHRSKGLDVGICTYGPNTSTWSEGMAMLRFTPDHSWEDWDLVENRLGQGSYLVQSLNIGSHSVRIPSPTSFGAAKADSLFREKLAEATMRIREEALVFRRAKSRNVPSLPDY